MTADPSARTTPAEEKLARAGQYFAAGRLADAAALSRSVAESTRESSPVSARARRQLGLVLVVQHAFDEARTWLEPLAPRFADDADFRLALAEAIWGTQTPAAALTDFEAACALAPDRPLIRLRLGQALLAAGRADDARVALDAVAAALPDSATALTQLGLAEAALGETDRALRHLDAALALDPADSDAPYQLGQVLRALGRVDEAIAALGEAVQRAPDSALLRVALGDALAARRLHEAAAIELKEAVRLAPTWGLAWVTLGRTMQRLGHGDEALRYYRTARGLDRGIPDIDAIIGNALLETGAAAEAQAHFARSLTQTRWAHGAVAPAPDDRLRVGVLLAPGAHNTPTGFILDPTVQDLELVFMVEGFDYPHDRIAASYDVLFNAIGDPDRAAGALACAIGFAQAATSPIVNPPNLIGDTARDRMAARLAGIEGCHAPPTRRCVADALRRPEALAALVDEIGLPLLARPVGSHGGDNLTKLDSTAALSAHAADTDALYLTRFCDFRSPDGLYRKYRFIVVDGEIFPYHLAIGDAWLVHYFRTEMQAQPNLLEEEARFLAGASLGPTADAALATIAARIKLDFFGIDCSVDQDGRLLVFECNAAMLVHNADPSPAFAFKRGPAERIRHAVGRLLARRAGRAAA